MDEYDQHDGDNDDAYHGHIKHSPVLVLRM